MRRCTPAFLAAALAASVTLPGCMDPFISPLRTTHRTVHLVERDGQKVATLGDPEITARHCTMLAESSYVFKPNGEAELQGVTTTSQPGDAWRHTIRLLSGGWTTMYELTGLNQHMDQANQRYTWSKQFHYPPSLYPAISEVEFHGEC